MAEPAATIEVKAARTAWRREVSDIEFAPV